MSVPSAPQPQSDGSTVSVLNPWLGARATEGATADRPPAPLRAGVYGELAWRGWHLVHQVRTQRPIAAVLVHARRAIQGFNSAVDHCADELHDGSEELMGRLAIGVSYVPRRIAAAVLAAAYAVRSLSAVTTDGRPNPRPTEPEGPRRQRSDAVSPAVEDALDLMLVPESLVPESSGE